jgi:hypothetical protein
MNKNEQNRVVAWCLKLLRQASDLPRGVAQTCRHFGLPRKKLSTSMTVRAFECSGSTMPANRCQPSAS